MLKYNRKTIIIAVMLMIVTNILMGVILMIQSRRALWEQINERMLDVSNTAASMLDGDKMRELKAEDKGKGGYYDEVHKTLRYFQDNIELEYIYAVNFDDKHNFSFSVDPADNPGEFGQSILTTDALIKASEGTPACDNEAHTDEWGKFYSAYSPVFDKDGKVAAIVGVDFSAEWIETRLSKTISTIVIIVVISTILALILAHTVATRNRRNVAIMKEQLDGIKTNFREMDRHLVESSVNRLRESHGNELAKILSTDLSNENSTFRGSDEINDMGRELESIRGSVEKYIQYMDEQAYIDELTEVNNKKVYKHTIERLDKSLKEKPTNFAVMFFDIDKLRDINVKFGFEKGDDRLIDAAIILKKVFSKENVYRVASDEFIVILENTNSFEADEYLKKLDMEIRAYNNQHNEKDVPPLAFAEGHAVYYPEECKDYRDVFIKAEENMKKNQGV